MRLRFHNQLWGLLKFESFVCWKFSYLEIKIMKWVTDVDSMDFNVVIIGCMGTLIILISAACFENVCENLPYLTNRMLVIIARFVRVWLLFNLSFTLLTKSTRLAMRNLIAHCVTMDWAITWTQVHQSWRFQIETSFFSLLI